MKVSTVDVEISFEVFWGNSIALDLSFGFAAVKFSIFLLRESFFATSSLTLN